VEGCVGEAALRREKLLSSYPSCGEEILPIAIWLCETSRSKYLGGYCESLSYALISGLPLFYISFFSVSVSHTDNTVTNYHHASPRKSLLLRGLLVQNTLLGSLGPAEPGVYTPLCGAFSQ
jgi:hypothetical protein